MKIEEKFVETKWGKICYFQIGSGKKTLLHIHGFGHNPETIRYLAAVVDSNTYKIVSPYLPGHGKSFEVSRNFKFDDAVMVLDEFVRVLNLTNITIYGHSLGGGLALALANQLGEKEVRRLILSAPQMEPLRGKRMLKSGWGLVVDSFLDVWRGRNNHNRWQSVSTEMRFVRSPVWKLLGGTLNMVQSAKQVSRVLPKSKTLFLLGKYDRTLDFRDVAKLMEKAGKVVWLNSGHNFVLSQPAQYMAEISRFLAI